jgi:hypothetical protein
VEQVVANNQQPKEKQNRESSIRWQGRTIEQFGYALNLILGLSVAALGYELSFLLNKEFDRDCWQTVCSLISLLFLFLSIALGLWCVVNRLRDFRTTTETAYKRENGASELDLQPLRIVTQTLGKRTWLFFFGQIWTFGIGILLLILAVGGSIAKASIALIR